MRIYGKGKNRHKDHLIIGTGNPLLHCFTCDRQVEWEEFGSDVYKEVPDEEPIDTEPIEKGLIEDE